MNGLNYNMQLRPYQEEGLQALWDYFKTNKGNPLLCWPTGVGKSLVPAEFIRRTLCDYPNQRFLMITHVKELINQNYKKMNEIWPNAPIGIYSAGLKRRDISLPIIYGGIQSMIKIPEAFGHRDLVFIDEAHLISDENSSQYRKFLNVMQQINPNLKVIGLTATAFRTGMGMLTEGSLFTDIAHDLTSLESFNKLIDDGYLCPLFPKRTEIQLDVSNVSIQKGEFVLGQLQHEVDRAEITWKGLQELCYFGQGRRSWLIYATGIEHANHIAEMLNQLGVECASVHSKQSDEYNQAALKAHKSLKLKAIVSYSKLTTGLDHPAVDLIGMFRPTMSVALWCLDEKTEILTKDGFKNHNAISEYDLIASVNKDTLDFEYVRCEGILKKNLSDNECFVSYNSPQMDWKVTNNHKMLVRSRYGRKKISTQPQLIDAMELIGKDRVEIAVSGNGHSNDLPLTDAELRFIGLFMTDGTLDKSNNAISIYQSDRYQDILCKTETCLIECNFKYSNRRIDKGVYHTINRFQISKGEPRSTDKHLNGWGRLEKWIDKDFAIPLMELSEKQFDVLIEAIHWGDGQKQPSNVNWKQRSYHISTGNIIFAERLQQVAVGNGWRCNITKRTDNVIMIRLKKQNWNVIQKSNDNRPVIKKSVSNGELVWCVQNKNSTLVTRRNGKVTIVGNCQMLGRGTRVWKEGGYLECYGDNYYIEGGKQNCLVLDFANNAKRLGPINDPMIPRKKGDKEGTAPIKLCENCGVYHHIKAVKCDNCGHPFQFEVKIKSKADTRELIAEYNQAIPEIETFNVSKVIYGRKQKEGKPPYIVATYFCGMEVFKEFVFPENYRYPKSYYDWWRMRHKSEPPKTTAECMTLVSELRAPRKIRVHLNRKLNGKVFPEILSVEF